MSGHGPDATTFEAASNAVLQPQKLDKTMAFMFETRLLIHPTRVAMESPQLQKDYLQCWRGLKKHFTG